MLKSAEAKRLRTVLVQTLAAHGEDFFPPLLEALKEDNLKVRDSVALALGSSAGDREVDLLIAARKDSDKRVRSGVKRALDVIKQRMSGTTTSLRKRKIPN